MKMRNLLFGVILGLFAVVHSMPVNNVIQSPAKTEDDFLREALTEEFLIDYTSLPSLTTESTKRNTTVQASQQPSSDSKESDMIDDSATGATPVSDESATSVFPQHGGEHYATTTVSVSHAQSSTSTVLPRDTDDSSSDSSTKQSPQSSFTSSPVPYEGQPNVTPDHISVSQTTDPAVSTFINLSADLGSEHEEMLGSATSSSMTSNSNIQTSTASSTSMADLIRDKEGSGSDLGSGMEDTAEEATNQNLLFQQHNTYTYSSNTQTSTASSTSMTALIEGSGGSGLDSKIESELVSNTAEERNIMIQPPNKGSLKEPAIVNTASPQNKGHSTPGWIIIVGFIVGVAALVMLCLAIATRDKWNGPKQASQLETKTNSSNQQRELEMETFLHKDSPRENGKAAEYTVIPLDELPEKYSSH